MKYRVTGVCCNIWLKIKLGGGFHSYPHKNFLYRLLSIFFVVGFSLVAQPSTRSNTYNLSTGNKVL